MTDKQIAEIEARANAAFKEPAFIQDYASATHVLSTDVPNLIAALREARGKYASSDSLFWQAANEREAFKIQRDEARAQLEQSRMVVEAARDLLPTLCTIEGCKYSDEYDEVLNALDHYKTKGGA